MRYKKPKQLAQEYQKWRPWDYGFTINLLVSALIEQGKHLLEHNICRGSKRIAKRCFTAAGQLDRAYNADNFYEKVVQRWYYSNPVTWKSPEIKVKSCPYIDRCRIMGYKVGEQKKKDAWNYLYKYIEHFWD